MVRGAAAAASGLVLAASLTVSAFAASTADSAVPVGALDGAWTVLDQSSDSSVGLDNYSEVFQRADGLTAIVSLVALPDPTMAQQVEQSAADSLSSQYASSGVSFLPTQAYGDANAHDFAGSDGAMVLQGHLFVDKGVVVTVLAVGAVAVADDVKTTSDTLANAQDNILPSN